MDRKKVIFLLVYLVFMVSLVAGIVTAEFNLNEALKPLQGLNLAETYEQYFLIIDSIVYFLFFISMAQVTLGKRFEGRGGQGLVVAVGSALAIAMIAYSYTTGFKLKTIGPIAAVLFAIMLAVMVYRIFRGDQAVGSAIVIAYVFGFVAIHVFFPTIVDWLTSNPIGGLVYAVLIIVFFIALFLSVRHVFGGDSQEPGAASRGIWPGGGEGGGGGGEDGEGPRDAARAANREARMRHQQEHIEDLNGIDQRLRQHQQRLQNIQSRIHHVEAADLAELEGLINELTQTEQAIENFGR